MNPLLKHVFYSGVEGRLRWTILSILEKIEDALVRKREAPENPPIFVFGLPRTGSTLLYQIICRGLKVSYFSNLMDTFNSCPVLAGWITKPFNSGCPPENFNSRYGFSPGWKAPSQGKGIWRRWFFSGVHYDRYMEADALSEAEIKKVTKTIASIEAISNQPFVNKWQGHAVHLLPLSKAFPKALFIIISRNRLHSSQSTLRSRLDINGNKNVWISAKPKEYDLIKDKSYIEQACEQIYFLEKNIEEDSIKIGTHRFLNLEYEDLCQNPRSIIQTIRTFYKNNSEGIELAIRKKIPESFYFSCSRTVSKNDYKKLKECLKSLYKQP
jgi:hypothetical protein